MAIKLFIEYIVRDTNVSHIFDDDVVDKWKLYRAGKCCVFIVPLLST